MIKEKKFDVGTIRSGFRVDSVQYVEEVQSTSYVMTHIQSGPNFYTWLMMMTTRFFRVLPYDTGQQYGCTPHL